MNNKAYRKFYLFSLAGIILLSAYPIYMGVKIVCDFLDVGFVLSTEYPKYVIPYTPVSIALIVSAAILPIIYKITRRFSQLVTSVLGVSVFLVAERLFEKIEVKNALIIESSALGGVSVPIESWQLSLCIATPEVLEAIGKPTYAESNPAYKVHFYIIAILIVLCVIGILSGFTKMIRENLPEKKKTLVVQTVAVALFVGLCIFACFTAFYRNGTINISPLSSFLTGLFFVVFGVTFGLYIAGFVCSKNIGLSVGVPAVCASFMTVVMYIGELILMGGEVFRFGTGVFFERMGAVPLSPCDIAIILLSGVITALSAALLKKKQQFKKQCQYSVIPYL